MNKRIYRIVRIFQNEGCSNEIVKEHLTLEEAQHHCCLPSTSSSTCTNEEGLRRSQEKGPWFDSYEIMPGQKP